MKLNEKTVMMEYVWGRSGLSNFEIDYIRQIYLHEKQNFEQDAYLEGGVTDNSIRQSKVQWMDSNFFVRHNCQDIYEKITNKVSEINEENYKFELANIEPMQLTEYNSEQQGFYRSHVDCGPWQETISRKLSFVIQLSDPSEFEGGHFIYNSGGEDMDVSESSPEVMQKGNIIVFPSFVLHGVTPVTKGVRHSLVGWCVGPRFK